MLPERVTFWPVVLRPFSQDDAPQVQLLAGERDVAVMTALIPHPYPDGAASAWISTLEGERVAETEYTYAVTRSIDTLLVGAVSLRPSASVHGNVGYWTGRAYWGRGYASAAAQAVIALAFRFLDCDELTASHLTSNVASARVMEKCRMQIVRREMREHRGTTREFCVRRITRESWEAR